MNQIKFSHQYPKLWDQTSAELLAVKVLDAREAQINDTLLEYDTKYVPATLIESCDCELHTDFDGDIEHCHYPLPKSGKLIQLIFLGDKGIPFCTIRPMFNGKFNKLPYYMSKIGYSFDIVLEKAVE